MKTQNTQTAPAAEKVTIESFVTNAKNQNPEGGELDLNEIEKNFKGLTRHEVLENVRKLGGVKLVVGRKTRNSRLAWGSKIPLHMQNPGRVVTPRKRTERPAKVESTGTEVNYNFKVTIGGKTEILPVKFELAAA